MSSGKIVEPLYQCRRILPPPADSIVVPQKHCNSGRRTEVLNLNILNSLCFLHYLFTVRF